VGVIGNDSTVTLPYNTEIGYRASTTGNISGIYDMSGCSQEYMASYANNSFGLSGFNLDTINAYDKKYFDLYTVNNQLSNYNHRILGDATGELGPFYRYQSNDGNNYKRNNWYNESAYFVLLDNPWFYRGGFIRNASLAGQLNFSRHSGDAVSYVGSRFILAN
jgi:hypothetical protein